MKLGPLDTRARIERKVVALDSTYGTEVVTWGLLAVVWCSVQDELPSRSETVKNGLNVATQRTRVRMRYRSDITSDMRLVINRPAPVVYQIVAGPAMLGNRDGLEVMVEAYST